MSDHYEVVFSCFLLDGTPQHVLDVLRWHLGLVDDCAGVEDYKEMTGRLLVADPNTRLPGSDLAELRLQDDGWGLFTRNLWLDDEIGWIGEFLKLIAPYAAHDGFGGYFRDVNDVEPTAFGFAGGTYGLTRGFGNAPRWEG